MATLPSRGEIWVADFDPVVGHEQAGKRPVLVVSHDILNHGPAEVLFAIPLTRTDRGVPYHIRIDPPEGSVRSRSYIMCEATRSISRLRLTGRPWGSVSKTTIARVEDAIRVLMKL